MSIDKATVARIATLSRIRVDEGDTDKFAAELSQILGWVEQLNEVDTTDVTPMAGISGHSLPWRADAVTDGGIADKILANAPEREDDFFTVPKVVE